MEDEYGEKIESVDTLKRLIGLRQGPYSYGQACLIGFVVGNIVFLIFGSVAEFWKDVGLLEPYAKCVAGGAFAFTAAALAANWRVISQARGGAELPTPMFPQRYPQPRADLDKSRI